MNKGIELKNLVKSNKIKKEWSSPRVKIINIKDTKGGTSNHPENVHPFGKLASV